MYGFPSEIAGLRFEWAWQNPKASRRLRHLAAKKSKESQFQYRIRVMSEMLNAHPWSRLPLKVSWLVPKYKIDLTPSPPSHMSVSVGYISAISNDSKNISPNEIQIQFPERISESSSSEQSENQEKGARISLT